MRSNRVSRRSVLTALAVSPWFVSRVADAQTTKELPKGFVSHLGSAKEFFESKIDNERVISIRSQATGGIVRYPVDCALEPGLRLQWDWRVNSLPSKVAESTAETHDYSSIAVQFDDGQDLSWYWSAALARGEHYACPLPGWPSETHVVVRTGAKDLGRWFSEDREIATDVDLALKNKPKRVVAVWLINYTMPQKQLASTDFRRISFVEPGGRERVVFPL